MKNIWMEMNFAALMQIWICVMHKTSANDFYTFYTYYTVYSALYFLNLLHQTTNRIRISHSPDKSSETIDIKQTDP